MPDVSRKEPFIPEPGFDPHVKTTWEVRCGLGSVMGRQRIKKSAYPTPADAIEHFAKVHAIDVFERNGALWGRWQRDGRTHEHPFFVDDEEDASPPRRQMLIPAGGEATAEVPVDAQGVSHGGGSAGLAGSAGGGTDATASAAGAAAVDG